MVGVEETFTKVNNMKDWLVAVAVFGFLYVGVALIGAFVAILILLAIGFRFS